MGIVFKSQLVCYIWDKHLSQNMQHFCMVSDYYGYVWQLKCLSILECIPKTLTESKQMISIKGFGKVFILVKSLDKEFFMHLSLTV